MRYSLGKAAILVVLCLAIVGVFFLKGRPSDEKGQGKTAQPRPIAEVTTEPAAAPATPAASAPSTPTPEPSPSAGSPAPKPKTTQTPPPAAPKTTAQPPAASVKPASLPRLLELGADKCVPCKMMQPVLEELRQEYAGKLQVDFIDVWKDPDAGHAYSVEGIPTQIFFDAEGKELFRHTGYYPKDEIVAKFAELGITL